MLMSYNNIIDYLYSLQSVGIKLGLDNISALLGRLDNPHRAFKSIHIAGTNGKGSTAAMAASMLQSAGVSTGLFTSPHLLSFTERIRVDGAEVTEGQVVRLAGMVREAAHGLNPTFFEVVTAMAFLHFRDKAVVLAIVETGLGGRLDSTNVIVPEVSVITPISMDHMDFLGSTLAKVASEKAGIIKPGVPVVSAPQEPEALLELRKAAARESARFHLLEDDFSYKLENAETGRISLTYTDDNLSIPDIEVPLSGEHQAMNATLAIKAFSLAAMGLALGQKEMVSAVRQGLKCLKWPGRLELVSSDPPVYLDGAHNPAASLALARELKQRPLAAPGRTVLVLGVMKDKDVHGLIRPLLPLAGEIICTAPAYGRATSPEELAGTVSALGHKARAVQGVNNALDEARATGKTVLVTGSFYTAGEALEALGTKGVLTSLRECAPR